MATSEKTRGRLLKEVEAVFGPYCGKDHCPALLDDLLRRLNAKGIEVASEDEIELGEQRLPAAEVEELERRGQRFGR